MTGMPTLGTLTLSGTRSAALHHGVYVVEHAVPGRDGGIVELMGGPSDTVELHGFFYSGSDVDKPVLQGFVGTNQNLSIPSTLGNNFFANGAILVKNVVFGMPAERGYPFYDWVIYGVFTSGNANVTTDQYLAYNFNYELPVNMTVVTLNWNYELPVNMLIEKENWNYELPVNMVIPNMSFVRIS